MCIYENSLYFIIWIILYEKIITYQCIPGIYFLLIVLKTGTLRHFTTVVSLLIASTSTVWWRFFYQDPRQPPGSAMIRCQVRAVTACRRSRGLGRAAYKVAIARAGPSSALDGALTTLVFSPPSLTYPSPTSSSSSSWAGEGSGPNCAQASSRVFREETLA